MRENAAVCVKTLLKNRRELCSVFLELQHIRSTQCPTEVCKYVLHLTIFVHLWLKTQKALQATEPVFLDIVNTHTHTHKYIYRGVKSTEKILFLKVLKVVSGEYFSFLCFFYFYCSLLAIQLLQYVVKIILILILAQQKCSSAKL